MRIKKGLTAALLLIVSNSAISLAQTATEGKIVMNKQSSNVVSAQNKQTLGVIDEPNDSVIKEKLVQLALNNPSLKAADGSIRIEEINYDKAKNSWLSSLSVSGNVNEFVVNNSANALYYPKYNASVVVPLDIFSRTKNDKKIATERIDIAKAEKEDKIRTIRKQVLALYENYKEKKELLRLQKIIVEETNESYITAQKNYTDGSIKLNELNSQYEESIAAQLKLVSAKKDYNVSVVELEEQIGVPLSDVVKNQ
ncbi:TolC family protein [Ferruginibacter albus]|uniref:TolC family protein n=1 Tax=Ferruginibacter albus TaxID=2875540 RepID=UPI001CC3A4E6|nr:TolC family protein [Ferruginibacter albus]UAY51324.1 TolC family protein [Ferruginibacter albus]